jgi:hypothetical protein
MPAHSVPPLDFLPSDLLSQPVVLVPDRGLTPHPCTSRPRLFIGAAVDVRARRGVAERCRRARRRRGLNVIASPGIRRIASFVTPRQRESQPRLLTLTAAALERSTASPAEQVFACTAVASRYSPGARLPAAAGRENDYAGADAGITPPRPLSSPKRSSSRGSLEDESDGANRDIPTLEVGRFRGRRPGSAIRLDRIVAEAHANLHRLPAATRRWPVGLRSARFVSTGA